MAQFVMRDGHPGSVERAALLDAANGDVAAIPTPEAAPVATTDDASPLAVAIALTPGQKAAATRAANKAKAEALSKVEPLRPQNIDPATGETVVLKEVIGEDGEVKQVPVVDDAEAPASDEDEADPFDAAVEAALKATDAPDDEAAALADA